jgi:hypothetical protein
MGVARQESAEAAIALWRHLQLNLLSVRRFREERAGVRPERGVAREVITAARRLNRALGRLVAVDLVEGDGQRVARTLRRTARVVQRQLAILAPPRPTGEARR